MPPVHSIAAGLSTTYRAYAGSSPNWVKVKNQTHPAMTLGKEAFA
jgi:hypothetical protein